METKNQHSRKAPRFSNLENQTRRLSKSELRVERQEEERRRRERARINKTHATVYNLRVREAEQLLAKVKYRGIHEFVRHQWQWKVPRHCYRATDGLWHPVCDGLGNCPYPDRCRCPYTRGKLVRDVSRRLRCSSQAARELLHALWTTASHQRRLFIVQFFEGRKLSPHDIDDDGKLRLHDCAYEFERFISRLHTNPHGLGVLTAEEELRQWNEEAARQRPPKTKTAAESGWQTLNGSL
jgi:hypothetical protein